MNEKYLTQLKQLNACWDAVEWFVEQKTPAQAWRDCTRPDWLLWYAGRVSGNTGSDAQETASVVCLRVREAGVAVCCGW